jgi:uncharacterized protein (TIGR02452 family)
MHLANVAAETLAILERGSYRAPSGATVDLREQLELAVRDTILYTPDELESLLAARHARLAWRRPLAVEVTLETTAQAARRLSPADGREAPGGVAALNCASARRPGGGFLGGARAQEEDLARGSGLYPCLLAQPRYYDANRAQPSALHTDHIIHSPRVPFFRDDQNRLLERPFLVSVITAPAPNAGEVLRREPAARPAVRAALERRAGGVLAVAADQGHRHLVLGAWGCGVFRNDPVEVADVFAAWLAGPDFGDHFDRVVFAVYDPSRDQATLAAFRQRFERHPFKDD